MVFLHSLLDVVKDDHFYLPFRSSDRTRILLKKMNKDVLDVATYLECGVLKSIYPMHDALEVKALHVLWIPKITCRKCVGCCCCWHCYLPPFVFWKDLSKESKYNSFEHLTVLKNYFGEKHAFFFAWYSHYTAHLSSAAVVGVVVLLVQIFQVYVAELNSTEKNSFANSVEHGLRSPVVPLYCVFMSIWTTFQYELWKRKESELAYRWDVMDSDIREEIRPDFKGDESYNTVTSKISKYYPSSKRRQRQCCSVPMLLFFILLAVIAFVGTRVSNVMLQSNEHQLYSSLGISVLGAMIIVVLDDVYRRIARRMTEWENHQYQSEFDSSLVMKTFWFMFINNVAPLMWTAFVINASTSLPLFTLFQQTAIQILTKNIKNVVKSVALPLMKFQKKRMQQNTALGSNQGDDVVGAAANGKPKTKLYNLIFSDIEQAALDLNPDKNVDVGPQDVYDARMEVLDNHVKAPADQIVNDYAELIIQYAFVTFFSNAFTRKNVLQRWRCLCQCS